MKKRVMFLGLVVFLFLFAQISNAKFNVGNILKGGKSGAATPASSSGSGSARPDLDGCTKAIYEVEDNIEYNSKTPDKIHTKLGKPAKVSQNSDGYYTAYIPYAEKVMIYLSCNEKDCDISCLNHQFGSDALGQCKKDVYSDDGNITYNMKNGGPAKLQAKYGQAKVSVNDPESFVGSVPYKNGTIVDISCNPVNCSVGCIMQ
jgi:hypothetical protein